MTYVIIHGKGLAGLAYGDPRDGASTRGVRGMQHSDAGLPRSALAGLGAVGPRTDGEVRGEIVQRFMETTRAWRAELDAAIAHVPLLPVLAMNEVKNRLKVAREQIGSQVDPTGINVIGDASIPLPEVERRVVEFLVGYYDNLRGQLKLAQQSAHAASMQGQLDNFRTSLRTVVRAAAKEVAGLIRVGGEELQTGLPFWLVPALVIAAGAYAVRSFK